MAGARQPLALLEAKGAKHLTKREKAERQAGEVKTEPPKQIRPPDYLPEALKNEFRRLGKQLREIGLLSTLDFDVLARYLMARQSYLSATKEVLRTQIGTTGPDGKRTVDVEHLEAVSRIQDRFFKQCQRCAADLGLTVTSRCRLVLPQGADQAGENPFETMMRERREARNRA